MRPSMLRAAPVPDIEADDAGDDDDGHGRVRAATSLGLPSERVRAAAWCGRASVPTPLQPAELGQRICQMEHMLVGAQPFCGEVGLLLLHPQTLLRRRRAIAVAGFSTGPRA